MMSMPRSSRSSTGSPAGCGLPGGSAGRSCSGCASPTSPGRLVPMIERRGITLVGVAVSNLDDGRAVQLALAIDRHSSDALDAALDEVRQRFGSTAITRAVLLGRGQGLMIPLLPD
jgi:hypothetical protein